MAITCDNMPSLEQLVNSLLVKDRATGTIGIRTRIRTVAAADIEPYRECDGVNQPIERVLSYSIDVTVSGEPALVLIVEA